MLLDRAFNARNIVVVGVSSNREKWSNILFRRLLDGPFQGDVIPVNPARAEIEGHRCYASISEVPGEIDYAQLLVPKHKMAATVRDCATRGVAAVHVLSSGFGEVSDDGSRLQDELVATLADSNTVMIGPNSLGLYSARAGIDFAEGGRFEPGEITFISQSGALCTDVLAQGEARGLKFSKILSVGNCADLDWPDYVRYCRLDPETGLALFYIESVSDGGALFKELRALAAVKPVLLLKGGRTVRGASSVVSHTGRLAGDYAVWQAMMRQAGVVELTGLDDMVLALQARETARRLPAPDGTIVGGTIVGGTMLIGCGGGISVLLSDAMEAAGIALPDLQPETQERLEALVPDAEDLGGIANPIEMPVDRIFGDASRLHQLVRVAAADPAIGSVLVHMNLIAVSNQFGVDNLNHLDGICDALTGAAKALNLPVVVVLRNGDVGPPTDLLARHAWDLLSEAGAVTVFRDQAAALGFLARLTSLREVDA